MCTSQVAVGMSVSNRLAGCGDLFECPDGPTGNRCHDVEPSTKKAVVSDNGTGMQSLLRLVLIDAGGLARVITTDEEGRTPGQHGSAYHARHSD
jgi:hypothetical protein